MQKAACMYIKTAILYDFALNKLDIGAKDSSWKKKIVECRY